MKKKLYLLIIFFISAHLSAQVKGKVVEEIVARVNNEVITLSDLQRARSTIPDEAQQDCRKCTPQQLQAMIAEKEKNLLRDLIDQSLLIQRGKDMGISVETDVVKRLDQIRQQNNLATMEELERAVAAQGLNFEDFKANIRNSILTQEVVRREVGSRINIGRDEVQKYYDEHKSDFQRPEQVAVREIFVSTDGKKDTEIPDLEKKAQNLLDRVKKGDDFGELAKKFSDGSTAKNGGELGIFQRGQLAKDIEDVVFKMNKSQMTEVIRTKTGFLILQVMQRYDAGIQPVEKVEAEIMNHLFYERMEPTLREYLKTLRQQSYVVVKAGFVDTSGVDSTPIQEVAAVPEDEKPKKKGKFLGIIPRKSSKPSS